MSIGHHGVLLGGLRRFIIPLTYDEYLSDDVTPLVRNGIAPWITPNGFYGDGYGSRYSFTGLGDWVSGDNFYLQASIEPRRPTLNASFNRDVIVSVGVSVPYMQFAVLRDPLNGDWLNVGFRGRNAADMDENHPIARRDWRYEGRYPELSSGGFAARPQAIEFDASGHGYTVSAHYEDNDSIFHKVDAAGVVTGTYAFGAASHFAALSRDSTGRMWTVDYATGLVYRIDETASLSSGDFTPDVTYDMSAITGLGAIDFITVSGTEYLLAGQYLTSGTPYLYVVPATELVDGATFALGDRFKRFVCQYRVQGFDSRAGVLYVTGNRVNTEVSALGRLYTHNISTALSSSSDGSSLAIVSTYEAPTQYPEDVSFDPDGRLWTMTEGRTTVGDNDGFLAIWSTALAPQMNTWSLHYNGSRVRIWINNHWWNDIAFASGAPDRDQIEIGGPNPSIITEGWTNGYFHGYVRNVYFSNQIPDAALFNQVVDGDFEPNDLQVFPLTITNPGAESGTTGWTNESGSLATRASNPLPYQGAAYFSGGANAQTIAWQSIDLLAASGLSQSALNAAECYVMGTWWQAAFGGTDLDACGLGLAYTDGGSETSRSYPALINAAPAQGWYERNFSKLLGSGDDAVRLIYRSDRSSGTNNDGYVDSVSAVLYVKP